MGRSLEPPGAAREHAGVAGSVAGSASPREAEHLGRPAHGGGIDRVQLDHVGADPRLELVRRALGDDAAAVDDDDGGGEVVGLIEILRRQHDVGPPPAHVVDGVPHLVAAPRVEAGRRLVEQQQPGRADEARPEVEPPSHPAGIGPDLAVGGLHQIHLLEDPRGRGHRLGAALAVQAGHHDEVLPAGHHLLDGGGLAGETDHAADGHRVASDVMAVDGERAAVGRDEGGHHADERGLPRAVGPEDGHRLAGRQGEGQVGEGQDLPELLGEAIGLDERVHARLLSWVAAVWGRVRPTEVAYALKCCLGRRSLVDRARGCAGPGPRGVTRGLGSLFGSFLGELEGEVHLLGVEVLGLEETPHVETLEGAVLHLVGEGRDELQLGDELALLVLRFQCEDARQPGLASRLLDAA